MKMKKILALLSIALFPAMMSADNVSLQKAQAIAEQFFASAAPQTRSAAADLKMIWDGEGQLTRSASAAPAFYVFNNESGKGFVIVSGDDLTKSPILGYSFDQNFDAHQMPYNLRTWMDGIRSDINAARQRNVPVTRAAQEGWTTYGPAQVTPTVLLETPLWDQRAPYCNKLPMGFVTGCPATAISIIMRYHKWPDKGVGTIPQYRPDIPAIKLGHTYDWDNMPMTYTDMPTDYQKDQVATLMLDVGAMIRTEYRGGSAGAKPEETLPQLMPIHMRYNKSTIKSHFQRNFSSEEWNRMLQKELDEKRPVLYGGYSSGGGHQFVLDGYAPGNYYHVNWGWSGVSNGFYLLNDMNPPEQGAGGSTSQDGFTRNQDAIIGIQPDPNNPGGGFFDLMVYRKFYNDKPYGMIVTETDFQVGKPFEVKLIEYQNKGSRAFAGQIAIAHYSAEGDFKGIICNKITDYSNYQLQIHDGTENYYTCTIQQPIEPGDRICGVFKFQNPSEWTIIRNGYQEKEPCIEEIVIMEEGATPDPQPTNDLADHISLSYNNFDCILKIVLEDGVTLQILNSNGQDITGSVSKRADGCINVNTVFLDGKITFRFSSPKRGTYEFKAVFPESE